MEFPECSICLDIYGNSLTHIKAPKILKCGDTFCKECLEDIIKRNETDCFECPLCKSQIKKEVNIDDYTTNKELIRLIDSSFKLPEKEVINQKEDINKPLKYTIIFLGNSGVGKTSIFQRLNINKFDEYLPTSVSIEILKYNIKYKEKKYQLSFYDTAGEERYKSITKSYLKKADGVLFIYSLSDEKYFLDLKMWYELYKTEKEEVIGVLIGNKSDINNEERKVNYEDAKQFADENGLEYFEGSAKTDKYIKKAIVSLLNEIIESKALYNSISSISSTETDNKTLELNSKNLKKESFCQRFC